MPKSPESRNKYPTTLHHRNMPIGPLPPSDEQIREMNRNADKMFSDIENRERLIEEFDEKYPFGIYARIYFLDRPERNMRVLLNKDNFSDKRRTTLEEVRTEVSRGLAEAMNHLPEDSRASYLIDFFKGLEKIKNYEDSDEEFGLDDEIDLA